MREVVGHPQIGAWTGGEIIPDVGGAHGWRRKIRKGARHASIIVGRRPAGMILMCPFAAKSHVGTAWIPAV